MEHNDIDNSDYNECDNADSDDDLDCDYDGNHHDDHEDGKVTTKGGPQLQRWVNFQRFTK